MDSSAHLAAKPCRICGSNETRALPLGQYAQFFRMRVDTAKDEYLLFSKGDAVAATPVGPIAGVARLMAAHSASLPVRAIRRIERTLFPAKDQPVREFRTYMQACASCHGVTPCHEWSYEDLLGLYRDYRSESYIRDRIAAEPYYAQIAGDVGDHPLEVKNRNAAVDAFLRENADQFTGGTMLDHGGSDGRFLPPFVYEHCEAIHIYEASDAPLHPSVDANKVSRIASPQPAIYSLLTSMHVLEHVGNPRALVIEMARFLAPGGLIYIEVPHDLTEGVRNNFAARIIDSPIGIHEHMNLFDRMSIPTLVESIAGLQLVDSAQDVVNFGWTKGTVGRFLVRKL